VNYINGPGIDDKLKQTIGSSASYFLQDHLGSTVGLVDQSGSITTQSSYDSFGNASGAMPTRYRYIGRELDEYTQLYYYHARFYDSQIGRFISEDPIGFGGGNNWYVYVGNNPIKNFDPEGTQIRSDRNWYPADEKNDPRLKETRQSGDLLGTIAQMVFLQEDPLLGQKQEVLYKCQCEQANQYYKDRDWLIRTTLQSPNHQWLREYNANRVTNIATVVPGLFSGGLSLGSQFVIGYGANEFGPHIIRPVTTAATDIYHSQMIHNEYEHILLFDVRRECYKKAGLPYQEPIPGFDYDVGALK
jgi:RHS repeat-associated protein